MVVAGATARNAAPTGCSASRLPLTYRDAVRARHTGRAVAALVIVTSTACAATASDAERSASSTAEPSSASARETSSTPAPTPATTLAPSEAEDVAPPAGGSRAPAATRTPTTEPNVGTLAPTTSPSTTEPAQRRKPTPLPSHRSVGASIEWFEPGPPWDGGAALTGLPIDAAIAARPALVVKIDNAPGGRPQWNLADADLVIEVNVEEITRFVAVYQSRLPDRIGPVRSVRTSDLDVVSALNRPVLAWSGGNRGVTGAVRSRAAAGLLVDLSAQHSGCFYRSQTRPVPHNLVLDPICAFESAPTAGPARPLFERDIGAPPPWAATPVGRFDVGMDGLTITWVWDAATGRYLRRQRGRWHTDLDGDVVSATNVVVMQVAHEPSVIDARSPHAITTGAGPVVVHRGGVAIEGTWWRDDPRQGFVLLDRAGASLTLAPGTVFVEMSRWRGA